MENKNLHYILGLDLGIASVGWAVVEIDEKENLTDKQCSKLIREAMVKHLKIVVDPEQLKELIREYIDEETSDEHLDIARATLKELKQIQVVLKEQ